MIKKSIFLLGLLLIQLFIIYYLIYSRYRIKIRLKQNENILENILNNITNNYSIDFLIKNVNNNSSNISSNFHPLLNLEYNSLLKKKIIGFISNKYNIDDLNIKNEKTESVSFILKNYLHVILLFRSIHINNTNEKINIIDEKKKNINNSFLNIKEITGAEVIINDTYESKINIKTNSIENNRSNYNKTNTLKIFDNVYKEEKQKINLLLDCFFNNYISPLIILDENLKVVLFNIEFCKVFNISANNKLKTLNIYDLFTEMLSKKLLLEEFSPNYYIQMVESLLRGETCNIYTLNNEYYQVSCLKSDNKQNLLIFQNNTNYIKLQNKENTHSNLLNFILNENKNPIFIFDSYKKSIYINKTGKEILSIENNIKFTLKNLLLLLNKKYDFELKDLLTYKETIINLEKDSNDTIKIKEINFFTYIYIERNYDQNSLRIINIVKTNFLEHIKLLFEATQVNNKLFSIERIYLIRNIIEKVENHMNKLSDYLQVMYSKKHYISLNNQYFSLNEITIELQQWLGKNTHAKNYITMETVIKNINIYCIKQVLKNNIMYIFRTALEEKKYTNLYIVDKNIGTCILVFQIKDTYIKSNESINSNELNTISNTLKLACLSLRKSGVSCDILQKEQDCQFNINISKTNRS